MRTSQVALVCDTRGSPVAILNHQGADSQCLLRRPRVLRSRDLWTDRNDRRNRTRRRPTRNGVVHTSLPNICVFVTHLTIDLLLACAQFLDSALPNLELTSVDLDPAMFAVSRDFFGFRESARLRCEIADGLAWVAERDKNSLDCLMVDVDSKSLAVGLSCPPPPFVEICFFQQIYGSLRPGGVFLLKYVEHALKPPLDFHTHNPLLGLNTVCVVVRSRYSLRFCCVRNLSLRPF